jgi:hypothetical protein
MSKICGSYEPATGFWKMNKLVRSVSLLYVNGRAALMLNAFHEREFCQKNTLPSPWDYAAEIEFWLYFGVCAKTIHWLSGLWLCYCVCYALISLISRHVDLCDAKIEIPLS